MLLGRPKDLRSSSRGEGGGREDVSLVRMSLPMAEREVLLIERLTKRSSGWIIVHIAKVFLVGLLEEVHVIG